MSGARRRWTINAALLSLGQLFTAIASLVLVGSLTRTLDVAEYATWRQLLLVYLMFSGVFTLGLGRAPFYFLTADEPRPRGRLLEVLIGLWALGLILGGALALGLGDFASRRFDNPGLADLLPWLLPYALFTLPMQAFAAVMVARDRVRMMIGFNAVSQLGLVGVALVAATTWGTAGRVIAAQVIWSGLACLAATVIMVRSTPPGAPPTRASLWEQLTFAFPLGLASLVSSLSAQLDKYIVSLLCDARTFAIYVTGAIEVPLVGIVTRSISSAMLPELAQLHKAEQPAEIVRLWRSALSLSLIILAPATFGVLLFGPEIAIILFGPEYAAASTPLMIYALMLPLRAAAYGSLLTAANKGRLVTWSAILGLALNAALSWVLVHVMGADGAAWASTLTTYGVVAYMLFAIGKVLDHPVRDLVEWRRVGAIMLCAGLPAAVIWPARGLLEPLPVGLRFLIGGGAYCGLLVASYHFSRILPLSELKRLRRRRG